MLEEKRKEYASQKTEILEKVHKPSEKFKNSESRTKQKSKSINIFDKLAFFNWTFLGLTCKFNCLQTVNYGAHFSIEIF